jgi:hypothetical protein
MVSTVKKSGVMGAWLDTKRGKAVATGSPVEGAIAKSKSGVVTPPTGIGAIAGTAINNAKGKPAEDPAIAKDRTNRNLLQGQGLDLDTILTPKGKRKKTAGLIGGLPQELETALGA